VARLIDDLDYYQVLRLPRTASSEAIRAAYHRESRVFHPDRYLATGDEGLREAVNTIAKRIKEAYAVLRHPEKRPLYDSALASSGAGLRYTEEARGPAGAGGGGRHTSGAVHPDGGDGAPQWQHRERCAVKMALAYEPANPRFLALRDELVRAQRGRKDRT
jgi:curved DNA-binding protein CbpA